MKVRTFTGRRKTSREEKEMEMSRRREVLEEKHISARSTRLIRRSLNTGEPVFNALQ